MPSLTEQVQLTVGKYIFCTIYHKETVQLLSVQQLLKYGIYTMSCMILFVPFRFLVLSRERGGRGWGEE